MNPPASSRWIQEFEKLLLRRQHAILYGNIHDLLLWRENYLNTREFLKTYFADRQFQVIFRYDAVEGEYDFPNREMRLQFDKLALRRDYLKTTSDLEEKFCHFLGALSQPATPVAGVLDLGDMLVSESVLRGSNSHPLLLLKKCTLEASAISDGKLKGYRNTLVILLSDLKHLPEWLYQNNPFVGLVQVSHPEREERRQFALRFICPVGGAGGFYQGEQINSQRPSPETPSELELLAEEFADLTEGFRAWDLEALRHTSWQQKIPLRVKEVWKLVDLFKFGQRQAPWEQMNREKISRSQAELSRAVIGQPRAVAAVTAMLTSARIGLSLTGSSAGKPKGIFFFVGPTGVGKTELAKAVTKLVFGDERAFARFDMSEYKQEQAAEKLTGAAPGYVGYQEGGQLTNRVLQHPYSILLFDEIEKAHPRVLDKFLQILEDGRLTDSKGQTAYFNQTAIIFTSNIGASDLTDPHTGATIRRGIMAQVEQSHAGEFDYEKVRDHFETEVKWYFSNWIGRAELLSRLGDSIVVFDILRPQFVRDIGSKFLGKLAEVAEEKYQLTLKFQPSILEALSQEMAKGNNLLLGGRRIKTLLETLVERPLNSWIFQEFPEPASLTGKALEVGIKEGNLEVKRV